MSFNVAVNKPSHYKIGKFESIDIIKNALTEEEFRGFCRGNVLKYILRADKKHEEPVTDYKKARVYLDWLIESYKSELGIREVAA